MNALSSHNTSSNGEASQLVIGWTTVVCGVLLLMFHSLGGMVLTLVGACVVGPVYLARLQREQVGSDSTRKNVRRVERATLSCEKEKALEYRDLFLEGVISREEYHNAVALLYPELRREMK